MLSAEEQEMHIRMVKDALTKFSTDLSDQASLTVEMDTETQKLFEDLKKMSQDLINLNKECEDANQINLKLLAKRMELLRKCDAIAKELKCEQEEAETNFQLLKEQRSKNLEKVVQYEDIMLETAQQLRDMAFFSNIHEVEEKIKEKIRVIEELKEEQAELYEKIENIKEKIKNTTCNVPENILDIVGKTELEKYLQNLVNENKKMKESMKTE